MKVLTNFGVIENIQRIMKTIGTKYRLSRAQAVVNSTLIYRYHMVIIGNMDHKGLFVKGNRGGALPRAN